MQLYIILIMCIFIYGSVFITISILFWRGYEKKCKKAFACIWRVVGYNF